MYTIAYYLLGNLFSHYYTATNLVDEKRSYLVFISLLDVAVSDVLFLTLPR